MIPVTKFFLHEILIMTGRHRYRRTDTHVHVHIHTHTPDNIISRGLALQSPYATQGEDKSPEHGRKSSPRGALCDKDKTHAFAAELTGLPRAGGGERT